MNKIELLESRRISLADLHANEGQVPGLPANPRRISPVQLERLKKSIQEDPEMLSIREILVYPYEGKYIVIGGNQRLVALQCIGITDIPCKVIPENATSEQLRAYLIKDNVEFGSWIEDMLTKDWDLQELYDYGMENVERLALDNIPVEYPEYRESQHSSDITAGVVAPGMCPIQQQVPSTATVERKEPFVPKDEVDISGDVSIAYRIDIICRDEQQQRDLYNELTAQGLKCRTLSLPQNVE